MVLGWLSGEPSTPRGDIDQKLFVRLYNGDMYTDPFNNAHEAPETPAHLFPLRAFKQAIFGTPKVVERTPHHPAEVRNTSIALANQAVPAERRRLSPARVPHAQTNAQTSPSKRTGILLTPGTGAQRHKTVKFGDGPSANLYSNMKSMGAQTTSATALNPHTLSCSAHGSTQDPEHETCKDVAQVAIDQPDLTFDLAEPRSASGQYWKREYEQHCEKLNGDLRRASKKEQIARRFAKLKDAETQELIAKLQQESSKVAELESRLSLYIEQLSESGRDLVGIPREPSTSRQDLLHQKPQSLASAELMYGDVQHQKHQRLPDPKQTKITAQEKQSKNSASSSVKRRHERSHPHGKMVLSSDIWADAFADEIAPTRSYEEIEVTAQATDSTRLPLRPRNENARRIKSTSNGSKELRLSAEKREAAKRRLDKRRLARVEDAAQLEKVALQT